MSEIAVIRVLVVDDHQVVRQGFATFIQAFPDLLLIGEAANGEEAISKYNELRPDVLLLDLIMPSMSGFDVLKTLREKYDSKALPILVLSNLGQSDDIAKAKEMGANEYIVKADTTLQAIIEKTGQYLN